MVTIMKKRLYIKTVDKKFHSYSDYKKIEINGHWAIIIDYEDGVHYYPAINIIKMQEKATTKALEKMPAI